MALENGLFSIYNTGTPLRYLVDVKPNYVGLAVFEIVETQEEAYLSNGVSDSWEDILAALSVPPGFAGANDDDPDAEVFDFKKSGKVDYRLDGTYVADFPGTTYGAIYKGRSYIYADGMNGEDELVDFSVIDIMVGPDGRPQPWRNRFALTKTDKISKSFRWRSVSGAGNALVVFMPFDTGDFTDCRVEVLCDVDPILLNNTTLTGRVDDATIENDGLYYLKWLYNAQGNAVSVAAGETVDVPFNMVWNNDGTAVNTSSTYKLEADAGYLPKRKVTTDATGAGTFKFSALGLQAGDTAKVKVSAEHFSNIGKITVNVI